MVNTSSFHLEMSGQPNCNGNEEVKRDRRRAANRKSARKSRYRELVMLEELQRSVGELSKKTDLVRQENETLKQAISCVKETIASDKGGGDFSKCKLVVSCQALESQKQQKQELLQQEKQEPKFQDILYPVKAQRSPPILQKEVAPILQKEVAQSSLLSHTKVQHPEPRPSKTSALFSNQVANDLLWSVMSQQIGASAPMLNSNIMPYQSILGYGSALKHPNLVRPDILQQQHQCETFQQSQCKIPQQSQFKSLHQPHILSAHGLPLSSMGTARLLHQASGNAAFAQQVLRQQELLSSGIQQSLQRTRQMN